MISILIPIYNYNAYPLVQELHRQCVDCGIDFEIICQDDASNSSLNAFNININALSNSSFVSLNKNLAHRENRNSLAKKAKFDYLLFIDGDSIVINDNYIKKYLGNLTGFDVIYGGRLHPEKCDSANQKLRWKYGRLIEDTSAADRKKKPYQSLLFNNTIIKKDCFNKVKFDKVMKKYGHDDSQLSFQLSILKSKILHLENPIEHGDIDTNLDYLKKTKESLENLITLYEEQKIDVGFIKLLQLYHLFKRTKTTFLLSKAYVILEKYLIKNLTGSNPNLLAFNIFRVGYLCSIRPK
ncbi:MAG: glycosyltransferase involved in cell wall biosynthesis [Flavobacteriales bacterium]|jgi:glycosyltransferase involved in cell wall biosynthesis